MCLCTMIFLTLIALAYAATLEDTSPEVPEEPVVDPVEPIEPDPVEPVEPIVDPVE